ncbi:hypothetical protein ACHHYP_14328 [Achlya hypogyna]|uniref:Uncharacterized protein n=1 Tax=Achlya hypogyna TaxID=1202772 RepID=A0A1V9YDK0_ACHHY|nr:hypothetical protein ACHHYP_14328 [Achlya hypogyna]
MPIMGKLEDFKESDERGVRKCVHFAFSFAQPSGGKQRGLPTTKTFVLDLKTAAKNTMAADAAPHPLDIRPDDRPTDLYTCLWIKSTTARPLQLRIPDTIVIEHGRLAQWFFTSKYGEVLRRRRDKLTKERVFRFFQDRLASGIAAVFVHAIKTDEDRVLYIEHLTLSALESLLYKLSTVEHGLLQTFVAPKSGYNTMIQTIFSHEGGSFRATRATNVHLMVNHVVSLSDRVATFEGTPSVATQKAIASHSMLAELKLENVHMIEQVYMAIGLQIARATFYFKIGADDRLYFLWAATIVFQNEDAALPYVLAVHPGVLMTVLPSPEKARRRKKCPGCRRVDHDAKESQVKFLVTFKAVIAAHAQSSTDSLEESEYTIPPIIRSTNTTMSVDKYLALAQTASFLYKTIEVCETCCRTINAKALLHPKELPRVLPPTPKPPVRFSIGGGSGERASMALVSRRASSAKPRSSVVLHASITPVLPSTAAVVVQQTRPASATSAAMSLSNLRMQVIQATAEHVPSLQTLLKEHDMHPQHSCVHVNYLSTLATTLRVALSADEWKAIAVYCEPHTDIALVDLEVLDELLRLPRAPGVRPQSGVSGAGTLSSVATVRPQPPSYQALRAIGAFASAGRRTVVAPPPEKSPPKPAVDSPDDLTDEERAWLASVLTKSL